MKTPLHRLVFSRQMFRFFERLGVHVTPRHFYSPLPDTGELRSRPEVFQRRSELPGIEMNEAGQLELLRRVVAPYLAECDFPMEKGEAQQFYVRNSLYGAVSACVLHALIRHHRPRTILEVGSGMSTLVAARAAEMNREQGSETRLVAIEPHPGAKLRGLAGLAELIEKPVQELPLERFAGLRKGDMLFIDSSHVVRTGGDVNFLYLEVLPRLAPGVLVHVHDVFFPYEYPRDWVLRSRRFWSEQYLLQAFLAHNQAFRVLWCESWLYDRRRKDLEPVFGERLRWNPPWFLNAFWMERVG